VNAPVRDFPSGSNGAALWRPGRLLSLWDILMHPHLADRVFLLANLINAIAHAAENYKKSEDVEEPRILPNLKVIEAECEKAGLVVAAFLARRLVILAENINPPIKYGQLLEQLNSVANSIEAELTTVTYFRLDHDGAKYFNNAQPFGEEVTTRFEFAIQDIEEAAKCLALSRGTAAVYHLMRIMELGLKALAQPLGIPYAPSWESYIKQITDKVTQQHSTKGVNWKKDEPFFKEILGDLQAVKIAWRNPTMHIVRHYTPDEAEDIFRAVRGFMKRLATRFSQVP